MAAGASVLRGGRGHCPGAWTGERVSEGNGGTRGCRRGPPEGWHKVQISEAGEEESKGKPGAEETDVRL